QGTVEFKPVAIDLKIWGRDVPIDAKLNAALQPEFQKLLGDFNARGLADLDISIHRERGAERCDNHYVSRIHDVSLRHEVFPYPIENASGALDVRQDRWDFRDFHGLHKGGEFHGSASSTPGKGGKRLTMEVSGGNVLLDAELEAALKQAALKTAWKKLAPRGRINFKAI